MNRNALKSILTAGGPLVLIAAGLLLLVAARQVSLAAPTTQQVDRFLSPPYYGTVRVNVVYDHNLPLMSNEPAQSQGSVTHYDNIQRLENCGTDDARQCYSGHNGIDYALRYELVRAAAVGNVAYAGWDNVANHRAGYGLYVDVDHTNGFHTIYGHMSVLHVETGDPIPESDEFQRILGRSGNTGWCAGWEGTGPDNRCTDNDPPTCGAHLHFHVTHNGRVVNPYGWISAAADPWSQHPNGATSVDRWLHYPGITNSDVFTSGAPLVAPPMAMDESGYFTVDDGDADYNETAGCWTADNTAGWNNDYRRRDIPGGNCTATWNFSQTRTAGRYNVFVHIPNDNVAPGNRRATVDAARYSIRHTPSPSQPGSKQTQIVVVNQWAYPNNAHTSRWVYLGAYYFDTNQFGTDYVRLESETMDSRAGVMAADAVLFAPVRYRTYLPLVLKCWPAILPATPALNFINNATRAPNYTVSWQPASGAATYTLQEATNPNFTGAVSVYTDAGTSWAATNKPVGTYYYRVRATNCAGNSGWSNVRSTTVAPPGWVTIASQNFEGTFPGDWLVWDDNGSNYGEYYWGKRTCRPYAGSYSGWGVGGGAQGAALSCGSNYPHNANSWLVYGPFSLMDAARAELQFKLWLYTEPDNDYVLRGASVDGVHFYGYATSGNTQGWADRSLDLSNVPTLGNLLGHSQVWVALGFSSNGSVNYAEGGYVDAVMLRQCYRECPSGSSASASGSGQTQEVSVMVTRQRGGALGAPRVEPQPFVSPLSAPEPFRSPLPAPGP